MRYFFIKNVSTSCRTLHELDLYMMFDQKKKSDWKMYVRIVIIQMEINRTECEFVSLIFSNQNPVHNVHRPKKFITRRVFALDDWKCRKVLKKRRLFLPLGKKSMLNDDERQHHFKAHCRVVHTQNPSSISLSKSPKIFCQSTFLCCRYTLGLAQWA